MIKNTCSERRKKIRKYTKNTKEKKIYDQSLQAKTVIFTFTCTEILEDNLPLFPQFDLFNLCEIESYK